MPPFYIWRPGAETKLMSEGGQVSLPRQAGLEPGIFGTTGAGPEVHLGFYEAVPRSQVRDRPTEGHSC